MLNKGSSCGNPSTGAASAFLIASPTEPSQRSLSITTDKLFMFPEESGSIFSFEAFFPSQLIISKNENNNTQKENRQDNH